MTSTTLPDRKLATATPAIIAASCEQPAASADPLANMAARVAKLGGWSLNKGGDRVHWSDRTCDIHEVARGTHPTLEKALAFYHPTSRPAIAAAVMACLEEGLPFDLELQLVTATGRELWVRAIGEAVRDAAGELIRIQGGFQDISETKFVQDELKRTASRLKATLETMSDAFFLVDHQWRFLYLNSSAQRLLQCHKDLKGEVLWEAFPAAVNTIIYEEYHRAIREQAPANFETYYPPFNNWYEVNAYPSQEGLAVYFRVITQRKLADQALRERDEILRLLGENINEVFWITDPVKREMLYVSPAYERVWGRPCQMLMQSPRDWLEAVHPEDRDRVVEAMESHGEGNFDQTYRIRRPDGEIRWIHDRARCVRNEWGKVYRVVGTAEDITDRHQAEEAQRKAHEKYRTLFNHAPEGIAVITPEGRFADVNPSLCRMLGYSRGELIGTDPAQLQASPNGIVLAELAVTISGGHDFHGEWRLRRKDGAEMLGEVIATRKPTGNVLAMIRDISERKRVDSRFRRLVESNAQGVFFWDSEGTITEANDTFSAITGYSREDLQSLRLKSSDITPPEYADVDRRAGVEIAATGVCVPLEKEYLRKDGTRVPVLVGAANFEDSPYEGVAFVLDLSQRKKLEQEFLRAQRMESIGILAGGIAHDLNNVLTPVLMSVDLLRMGEKDDGRLRTLLAIEESARRGSDLIQKLLAFARGSEKRRTTVNIKQIIEEIALVTQNSVLKNIEVKVTMPDDLWTASADPTGLHQVLMNLCVNARDAMPTGGLLRLSARNLWLDKTFKAMEAEAEEGPYVMIEVEDTGVGMEPATLERIFEPFFTTKQQGEGSGLGLSTVIGIVKSHGGMLQVESKRGKGSIFRIYLPANGGQVQVAPITVSSLPPAGNGELVLFVDDEPTIRHVTKQTLEEFGYNVLLASDGVEAAAIFAERGSEISAVVTDLMMPIMDGRLTMQVMKKMNPSVRLVATSGFCDNGTPEQLDLIGVQSFLRKPFTGEDLLKTLAKVLPADSALAALN